MDQNTIQNRNNLTITQPGIDNEKSQAVNEGQKHTNAASGSDSEDKQLHVFDLTALLYVRALKQARPQLTQEEWVSLYCSHSAFRTENVFFFSAPVKLIRHVLSQGKVNSGQECACCTECKQKTSRHSTFQSTLDGPKQTLQPHA